jgi:DNA invertase Pin-like site-specific DNA recombinase
MNLKRAVAYGRVSTLLNQDVNNQLIPIRSFATQQGYDLTQEYIDEGFSGSVQSRPALDKLIRDAKNGDFEIVICASIDRLGRSLKHLVTLLDLLMSLGVKPVFIREGIQTDTNSGKLIYNILSSLAEYERSIISERIKVSLAVKKTIAQKTGNGWTCGRPPIDHEIIENVLKLHKDGLSIRKIANKIDSISKSSVANIIKKNI